MTDEMSAIVRKEMLSALNEYPKLIFAANLFAQKSNLMKIIEKAFFLGKMEMASEVLNKIQELEQTGDE